MNSIVEKNPVGAGFVFGAATTVVTFLLTKGIRKLYNNRKDSAAVATEKTETTTVEKTTTGKKGPTQADAKTA